MAKKELTIPAQFSDKLIIRSKRKNVEFDVYCDGYGFVVSVPKRELIELMKS